MAIRSFILGAFLAAGVPTAWTIIGIAGLQAQTMPRTSGVLLLAHGGAAEWNDRVTTVGAAVDKQQPTEIAFGMASRAAMQAAVDRLEARGVTEIVAVPLFVSSWSSVIRATEFLLTLRKDAPADLALFAKMDHGSHGAGASAPAGHGTPAVDGTVPLAMRVPVRMTAALNRHPRVGRILADRAAEISRNPASEAVVIVAHGPVPEEDNRLWLGDMASLAGQVRASRPFAAVHFLTVRDDAPAEMKAAATAELRSIAQNEIAAGRRVLIVPHLMSFGGIEQGVRKRLDGLDYTMAGQALMPDARITEWVIESATTGTQPASR